MSPFDLAGLREQIDEIDRKSRQEGFWDDPDGAQALLKKTKTQEKPVEDYERIEKGLADTEELIAIAEELGDESEADSIIKGFEKLSEDLEELRITTLLNGKYDHNSAILSIHAGTGGIDAMDWAEMLMRMYTRWSEKKGYKVTIADLQRDPEAGIKSATLMIDGENAYGYLKNENGVHRLVRISPFNAAGKRQTSFAAVEVIPEME